MSEYPSNFYYKMKIIIDSCLKNSFDFNSLVNVMLNLKKAIAGSHTHLFMSGHKN